jgi:hypothetical protein
MRINLEGIVTEMMQDFWVRIKGRYRRGSYGKNKKENLLMKRR